MSHSLNEVFILTIHHQCFQYHFSHKVRTVHVIQYEQSLDNGLTLLISKASEAVRPEEPNNHIGDGATLDGIIQSQSGIRFIINAGFNHYRKNFYQWNHQDFNVGDPVGIVKIRQHLFEDFIKLDNYGFLTQERKNEMWKITDGNGLNKEAKYILGCTPLLIHHNKIINIPEEEMIPVKQGEINPPSFLGHGLQDHPRTAVGIKDNVLYFIIVENNSIGTGGCSLLDLQDLGTFLELDSLLNLDGGGSSQFKLTTDEGHVFSNYVLPEDANRVLGHSLIIFDESLK